MSLFQILESLQNKNDCASAATAPPAIVTSTAGIIDTSCNEIIVENRVDNNETGVRRLSEKSNNNPVDNGRLKGYFCFDVAFHLSHRVLSELEIELLGKGLYFSPTPSFINEADPGISKMISVKTLMKHQLFALSLLGIHHKDTLHYNFRFYPVILLSTIFLRKNGQT